LQIVALPNANIQFSNAAVVTLLKVPIPCGAHLGDTYSLAVSYPSATSDGYNTPVSLTPMTAATIQVADIPYLVGDAGSPSGSWYNAGAFGNGDLDNSDVNVAFWASLGKRVPFAFSDVFNAMDAYPADEPGFVGGDGQIRFLDWNTILERSKRSDSNNWVRAWSPDCVLTNGPVNSLPFRMLRSVPMDTPITWTWYRQALIGGVSVGNAAANTTVSVPVYVKIGDSSTLAGLQFRAVVTPQGGAPALTSAPQLSRASGVPVPDFQQSFPGAETAFGWTLGKFSYLSRSSNFLGWVTFTVPAGATAGQSYAVSFKGADGAPNLTTQYDFESRSATVVVGAAAAPASICSDEWKVRFFGSTTSPNAADNADSDGDHVPNWMEYIAGTDPTDASSKLQFTGAQKVLVGGKPQLNLSWQSAPGKAYEVQWSTSAAGGVWNTLTTVSGDGSMAVCPDTNVTGSARFYRLRVLP